MVTQHKTAPGQSLAEYGLIASLVALLSISALVLLGNNLGGMVQDMQGGMMPTAQMTANSPTGGGGPADGGKAILDSYTQGSGSYVPDNSIPLSTAALADTVKTSGANGTTSVLANRIEAIAKQQLETGEITEEQYNAYLKLANQGHKLADYMAMVESTADKSRNFSEFDQNALKTKVIDGERMNVYDAYTQFGFKGSSLATDPLSASAAKNATPGTKEFVRLYGELEASGALNDPAIAAEVSRLSEEILWLGDALVLSVKDADNGKISVKDFSEDIAERLTKEAPSAIVDENSGQICGVGGGNRRASESGTAQCG